MSTQEACPLCGLTAEFVGRFQNPIWRAYACDGCGAYAIDARLETELQGEEAKDTRFRLACVVREMRGRGNTGQMAIASRAVPEDADLRKEFSAVVSKDELLGEFPSATEIIDRALLNLWRGVRHPADCIQLKEDKLPFVLFCPRENVRTQIGYMSDMGLIRDAGSTRGEAVLTITPAGWTRVHDLERTGRESRQAFVAMWSAAEMDAYWAAVDRAIGQTGYVARRADLIEHNNDICDEIIAELRRSRFIVADFTGQRGGVYFEAGYAMGMGIPVIWLVRKDRVDDLHFDTRQYNHIVYESPEELEQKLRNRIAATIY